MQWICGDDAAAKLVVARLVDDAGFRPVDLGGTAECAVMEAPRRPGPFTARSTDSQAVVDAVRAGEPIPRRPDYTN